MARHHLRRMLKHQHGAQDFLELGQCVAARTIPELARAFRGHFAAQLGRGAGASDEPSDEESDDTGEKAKGTPHRTRVVDERSHAAVCQFQLSQFSNVQSFTDEILR